MCSPPARSGRHLQLHDETDGRGPRPPEVTQAPTAGPRCRGAGASWDAHLPVTGTLPRHAQRLFESTDTKGSSLKAPSDCGCRGIFGSVRNPKSTPAFSKSYFSTILIFFKVNYDFLR